MIIIIYSTVWDCWCYVNDEIHKYITLECNIKCAMYFFRAVARKQY